MLDTLAHRAPGGADVWLDDNVGLGYCVPGTASHRVTTRRLGHQVVAADARIDNRAGLIQRLRLPRRERPEFTDDELILAACDKWGESCAENLVGDFAFVAFNRSTRTLLCARDHFGIKPFYYYISQRVFVFASEIKALLSLRDVPQRLNEGRIADYLAAIFDDSESTFYRDIWRLPPGHTATVASGLVRVRPYWSPDPTHELRLRSPQSYAEAFQERFEEAVRCRLTKPSSGLGSTLSGGLDSSSVTCVARDLLRKDGAEPLSTFSLVFDGVPECDERLFISSVVARGGIRPHFLRADLLSPLRDWERVLWHQDEPFGTPNLFLFWALFESASQYGVHVLLDGIDGDTTVSHGFGYLSELASSRRWLALASEAFWLGRLLNRSPAKLVWRYVWRDSLKPLAPKPLRSLLRPLRAASAGQPAILSLIHPDLARRCDLADRMHALSERRWARPTTERQDHARRLRDGIRPLVFEVIDKAGAAFSVEPRHPFFDKRLVEFCLALPAEQKLSRGWTRAILRRSMNGVLPDEIRCRPSKANLTPHFTRSLFTTDAPIVDELILRNDALSPFVDLRALRDLHKVLISGAAIDGELRLWRSVILGLWLSHRQHRTAQTSVFADANVRARGRR